MTLLRAAFRLACGLRAVPVIGRCVMTVNPINPLNVAAGVAWFFTLRYVKVFNKKLTPTWTKAALWAVLFYFLTVTPVYCLLILFVCKAV